MARTFERLGALDSFFLDCESESSPMHIGAVCVFAAARDGSRPVSVSRLRRHVESRLDAIPRYRQCIERVPWEGHPVWVDAADFRIENHVRAIALASPRSCGRLEETVSWIFSQALARSRPLWEIWLVEGLKDGAIALVCKVHHCMADGLGAASLLCAILGMEPFVAGGAAPPWTPRPRPKAAELLGEALGSRVRAAFGVGRRAGARLLESPAAVLEEGLRAASALRSAAEAAWRPPVRTSFDGDPGASRRFLWWSVPLGDIKQIGRRLGGTVNDVALALVSEAFAQSGIAEADEDGEEILRVFCPVGGSEPRSAATLGNRVSGMLLNLPVGEQPIRARWHAVLEASRRGKESGAAQGTFLLEDLAEVFAPSLLSRLERTFGDLRAFNLVMTNVPGPGLPLYLFEHKMTGAFPLVPLFRGQRLGIALFSYNGSLLWGLHADASCLDAARQLRQALQTAFERFSLLAEIPAAPVSQPRIQLRPHADGADRRSDPRPRNHGEKELRRGAMAS